MRVGGKLNPARIWRLLNSQKPAERRTGLLDIIRAFGMEDEIAFLAQNILERVIAADAAKVGK